MKKRLINASKKIVQKFGFNIVRYDPSIQFPPDFDRDTIETIVRVSPFTQTSPERIFCLCEAVKYIAANNIPGDIVECGVWKGGSMMAVAHTLCQIKDNSRHLFLFDTFEGMTEPSEKDVSFQGISASSMLKSSKKEDSHSVWCYAPLEEVKQAINSIGYDPEKIHLIKGRVEDTIPKQAPLNISLLRLDTDWYESTRHELIHLFPRLSPGGVIIIDDYGYWKGARQAVDEYMKENKIKLLLNRTDITGRIGVVWR